MDNNFTHVILFYVNEKDEAKTVSDSIAIEHELIETRRTQKGNFRVKIAMAKENVCDIACALTQQRKNIFVYDWNELRKEVSDRTDIRKRFLKAARYYCDKLLDEDKKTPDEIKASINSGEFFEDSIVKSYYENMLATNAATDEVAKDMAVGSLKKVLEWQSKSAQDNNSSADAE